MNNFFSSLVKLLKKKAQDVGESMESVAYSSTEADRRAAVLFGWFTVIPLFFFIVTIAECYLDPENIGIYIGFYLFCASIYWFVIAVHQCSVIACHEEEIEDLKVASQVSKNRL